MNLLARQVASVALVLGILTACSNNDPASLLASARSDLAKHDVKAAIIKIKSALQEAPQSAEGRFLLGKALLAAGDAAGAALELRKAMELNHPEAQVVPEFARAVYAMGDHQRLVTQFAQTSLPDPLAHADLKAMVARSYGALGRLEEARATAQAALGAVPNHGPANLVLLHLQAGSGDVDGALAALNAQLERTPQDPEAWQFRGDLLALGKRDFDGALAAYRQSLGVKPDHLPAHGGAISALLAKRDLAQAQQQLAGLQKIRPGHPQTLFYEAEVALLGNDLDKASEISQQLLRMAPQSARILQLAGAVEMKRGSWAKAEVHLAKALQLTPNLDGARRLLAFSYLQRAEAAKTLATLQPLLERSDPEPGIYAIKARAHLLAGELGEAEAAFAQAAKLDPKDDRSRASLAFMKAMKGDLSTGAAELEAIAASEDSTVADLPLITAMLGKKDYPAAMKAIDALEKKQPNKTMAPHLRAQVLLTQGDRAGARRAYERALEIQPSFLPAAEALARLALADNKPDEANARLDAVVRADPRNTRAVVASAAVKALTGAAPETVIAMLKGAIEQAPSDPAPRLALVDYHLTRKDVTSALEAARQAAAALPDNAAVLDVLGRAQAASGDNHQAFVTFKKLAEAMPGSPAPFLRFAELQMATKDHEAAVRSLKRALEVDPDNLQAQRTLVNAYLSSKMTTEALAVAREIRKQRPKQDVGFLIEGDVEAVQKRWDRALDLYRQGLTLNPDSTALASRAHAVLITSKRDADAERHAAAWLKAHPKDAAFLFLMGDAALARRDYTVAEARYREVLKLQPGNALAINNVAWLMATTKKPGAVAMAEKAVSLLPGQTAIMDTLALALVSEGRPAEAVRVMRDSLKLDDKNPNLRLRLAKLLVKVGRNDDARTELSALAALGSAFPHQREVSDLLKSL